MTSSQLGSHVREGREHVATASPTRTRWMSQEYIGDLCSYSATGQLTTLPFTGALGGPQPAEGEESIFTLPLGVNHFHSMVMS